MGTLESVIWNILGYSALPLMLFGGYVAVAVVGCFLLELFGWDK